MRYEKELEQCFHMKTKQIFRKTVHLSRSCATCEWCSFLPLFPLAGLAAEWSRDLHPGLHSDVTVMWPMVRIHGCWGFYDWKKTSPEVKWRSKTTESPLSTESGIYLQESSAVIPHWAPVTSSSSVKQSPTGQRLLANRGTNQAQAAQLPSWDLSAPTHPGIPPPAATS